MKPTKVIPLVFAMLLIVHCGSSHPPVGSGDPYSDLSPTPTGDELLSGTLDGLLASTGSMILRLSPHTAHPFAVTQTDTNQYDCTGGGTLSQIMTENSSNGQDGTVTIQSTMSECHADVTLPSGTYSETVEGTSTIHGTLANGQVSFTYSIAWSISGELGYSMECGLSGTGSDVNFNGSGTCTFRDSLGTVLTASAI